MSKLGMLQQYRYSPAAGGFLSGAAKFIGKIGKGVLGLFKKSKTAQVLTQQVLPTVKKNLPMIAPAVLGAAVAETFGGGGGGSEGAGASGGWTGGRRRSRGITARELRGYRKVANLLHKEGMVSRRAHRGRSH